MKNITLITTIFFLLSTTSCAKEPPDAPITSSPQLLFSSGFEDGVYLENPNDDTPIGNYQLIQGTDYETGFSFPIQVLGATTGGLHFVDSDGFQALENEIQRVVGHDGELTKALYSIEHYDTDVTQCPYEILDVVEGKSDLYIRYWMKVDSESVTKPGKWRALFEWKTKNYALGIGFRLISYIYTDEDGSPPYWHWQGDANPQKPIWEIDNREIPVPLDEWFLTEYYWHWSEGDDGRALWKINGQIVGDHYGATTRNSQPIDFIMLTQIYGDANPKYQWVDDIEIWDEIPE